MNADSKNPSSYRMISRVLVLLLLFAGNIILGTAWHEIVGHGLVGIACGGRIRQIIVTGVELWPRLSWTGPRGAFGWCDVEGVTGGVCTHLWLFTGSLSTLLLSLIAIVLLHARKWNRTLQLILLGCAFWWIDLFTYTLPSFGLPRYIILGRRVSEPYAAAVAMGIPGWIFQLFVVATCVMLAVLSVRLLLRTFAKP
jgi:hypothetical protein